MNKLKKVWNWIKTHPKAMLGIALSVAGAFVFWKLRSNKLKSFMDAVVVRNETKAITAKSAKATQLFIQGEAKGEEAKKIEAEIDASKRRVVEIYEGPSAKGLSDDEIARLYTKAGF